jgi:hypothetical protein
LLKRETGGAKSLKYRAAEEEQKAGSEAMSVNVVEVMVVVKVGGDTSA